MDSAESTAWTLFFHGSEIASAALLPDGSLVLHLAAAAVKTPEGLDGFASGVRIRLNQAQVRCEGGEGQAAELLDLVGGIADGHLQRGAEWMRQLPLPYGDSRPHSMVLRLISGTDLSVQAQGLHIDPPELPNFRESLAC